MEFWFSFQLWPLWQCPWIGHFSSQPHERNTISLLLNILIKGWDTCQAALFPLPHWKSLWQLLGFKMSQGASSEEFQGWTCQGRDVRGQLHTYWKVSGFSRSLNPWKNYIWDSDYFERDSEGILGSKATNTQKMSDFWVLIHLYNQCFILRVLQNIQENSCQYLQSIIPLPYCQQTSH